MSCQKESFNATEIQERGFLIPPWYHNEQPNELGLRIVWLVAGLTIPLAGFTAIKAIKHSWSSYKSRHLYNAYIIMVWAVWITSVGISVTSFLFLTGVAPPSFWTFLVIRMLNESHHYPELAMTNPMETVLFWLVQMQCILQIVANRVSVLMASQREARNIKVGIGLVMTFLTFSVACTWMPARLQVSAYIIRVNNIWDRASKALFLCTDLTLNVFFLKTVSRKLISAGLTKYKILFQYNACMVCVSMLIDASYIGVMSLQSPVTYFQFNPLVLLWKLYIELNLAELIAKVVHASKPNESSTAFERQWGSKMQTFVTAQHVPPSTDVMDVEKGGSVNVVDSASESSFSPPEKGIMKTVELQVMIQRRTHDMVGDVEDGPAFM
ncbi:hypothetical protein PG999_000350 [Apiospora kogelbergensis]|uniref:Uncharacterized protein n=1 Tax=Apiospora kogelbergensis TaxID=1337665 RepID=A0AAW0RB86_9PEZI